MSELTLDYQAHKLIVGVETVYHAQDPVAYRHLGERLYAAGYDFPQCLSGVDMEYGLRVVVNLRRLRDQAEVTLWLDVTYESPQVPTLCDLWGGLEWHEREAYDLVGLHFSGHPDHRRILLEDDWTIHPLQRRFDTGGYLIPEWQPKPWPEPAAVAQASTEAEGEAVEAKATAAAPSELSRIKALSAAFAAKLEAQGITSLKALAELSDEALTPLATAIGLKSGAAVAKWREQARQLAEESDHAASD